MFNSNWLTNSRRKLTLWERIRLLFKPESMSLDVGNGYKSIIRFKTLNGKIYFIGTK